MTLFPTLIMAPVLFVASFGVRPAQIDATQAASNAKELVSLLINDAMVDNIMEDATAIAYQMGKQELRSKFKRELTPTEEEKIESAANRTMIAVFPKQLWQDAFLPVYTKIFDPAEIEGLLMFYKTPLGQKFLEATPKIYQEGSQIGQQLFQAHRDEFFERFVQELLK